MFFKILSIEHLQISANIAIIFILSIILAKFNPVVTINTYYLHFVITKPSSTYQAVMTSIKSFSCKFELISRHK